MDDIRKLVIEGFEAAAKDREAIRAQVALGRKELAHHVEEERRKDEQIDKRLEAVDKRVAHVEELLDRNATIAQEILDWKESEVAQRQARQRRQDARDEYLEELAKEEAENAEKAVRAREETRKAVVFYGRLVVIILAAIGAGTTAYFTIVDKLP